MTVGEIVAPELIELLYDPALAPEGNGKMHVAAFASGSGTNFREAVLDLEVAA